MNLSFDFLKDYWAYFNYGVLLTLVISTCVVFLGSILGFCLAMAKRIKFRPLAWLSGFRLFGWLTFLRDFQPFSGRGKKGWLQGLKPLAWLYHFNPLETLANLHIWIFRGTPMVVQIMISFAVTKLEPMSIEVGIFDVDLARLLPGIGIISLNSAAYISEIIRAGLDAVPIGQTEAAYSLGLKPLPTMRHIIMPQAIKTILPALGNEFITIVKDSSLLSTVGVTELWYGAASVTSLTYQPLSPLLFAAFYYLIMTSLLSLAVKTLEGRLNKGSV